MLISYRHEFIYLKTRKTGGTSVEIFFEPYCYGPEPYPGPAHYRPQTITDHGVIGRRGGKPGTPGEQYFNHMPAALLSRRMDAAHWTRFLKFCVVRNPYDEAVSAFWFRWADQLAFVDQGTDFTVVRAKFAEFLADPASITNNRPLYMVNGQPVIDVFLRYESLEEDVQALVRRLRLPDLGQRLGRYKASFRKRPESWQAYYDPAAARLVEDRKRLEFRLFGYAKLAF